MAIRTLRIVEDPILRKKSKPINNIDDNIINLISDMKETLIKNNGVGLAAVQIGVLKRLILVKPEEEINAYINPEIISESDEEELGPEGCLSIPNVSGEVYRPTWVEVKYTDMSGKEHVKKFYDFEARIFCHEIDHLNGILFTDKVEEE